MLRALWFPLLSLFTEIGDGGDPPDPDAGDLPGNGESEEDAARETEFDATKNPVAKFRAMQDHIGRLHRRLDERDARIRTLEAQVDSEGGGGDGTPSGDANELRMENAFLRAVMVADEPLDTETAWDLLHVKGFADAVKVGDDGKVTGMDDALGKLIERYPWLADASATPPPEDAPHKPAVKGARKPQSNQPHGNAALRERFPALQHRRGPG